MIANNDIMAKNITRLMAEKGVKAVDVCEALGFKKNTFSDWVNGKKYPRIDKIEMMAAYNKLDEDKKETIRNLIKQMQ